MYCQFHSRKALVGPVLSVLGMSPSFGEVSKEVTEEWERLTLHLKGVF